MTSSKNVKIQGEKQANAVRSQLKSAGTPVGKGLDSRISYFNFSGMTVDAKYTGSGHNERTCQGFLGTPFGAGSTEDGGGGWAVYKEGSGRPSILGTLVFTPSAAQTRCQQPKGILFSAKMERSFRKSIRCRLCASVTTTCWVCPVSSPVR